MKAKPVSWEGALPRNSESRRKKKTRRSSFFSFLWKSRFENNASWLAASLEKDGLHFFHGVSRTSHGFSSNLRVVENFVVISSLKIGEMAKMVAWWASWQNEEEKKKEKEKKMGMQLRNLQQRSCLRRNRSWWSPRPERGADSRSCPNQLGKRQRKSGLLWSRWGRSQETASSGFQPSSS